MSRKLGRILEISIDSTSTPRVLRFVRECIGKADKFYLVTLNPEIVLKAQKDKKLKKILNSADLSLPDGVGLIQAAKFLQLPTPRSPIFRPVALFFQGVIIGLATFFARDWLFGPLNLIKGREVFYELMKLANKKRWRVFLLGGEKGVAQETRKELSRSLKSLAIEVHEGPMLDGQASPISDQDRKKESQAVSAINKFKPEMLFVAFGAPKQEKWLYKWLPKLKIGGGMVVGGTFDYISGAAKLPPAWMEELGLEWVWRLITRPYRFRRIFTAFPIFPLKVFWSKLLAKNS